MVGPYMLLTYFFKNVSAQDVYNDLFIVVLYQLNLFYFTLLNHIAWLLFHQWFGYTERLQWPIFVRRMSVYSVFSSIA